MKIKDLRGMQNGELQDELFKLRREQFNLRMQAATGQAARADQPCKVRKDIARIKTILRERFDSDVTERTK
jgi:large subunit ribosomal protein L29